MRVCEEEERHVLAVRVFGLLEQLAGGGAAGAVSTSTCVWPAPVSRAAHGSRAHTSRAGAGPAAALA